MPVPTTHTELVNEVANFLARDELASDIPTFIGLAEVKFNRALRAAGQEVTTTLTPADDGTVALPTGYRQMRSITSVSGGYPVDLVTSETFDDLANPARGGTPAVYCIVGTTLKVCPAGPVKLVYYKGVDALRTAGTNWLLQAEPDVYLYGALAEAELFNKNPQSAAGWQAMAEGAMGTIVDADRRARWGSARQRPTGRNP
jgi:hypothetical protein